MNNVYTSTVLGLVTGVLVGWLFTEVTNEDIQEIIGDIAESDNTTELWD